MNPFEVIGSLITVLSIGVVLVMADDALHGHASPNLLARAVAHWLAVQR